MFGTWQLSNNCELLLPARSLAKGLALVRSWSVWVITLIQVAEVQDRETQGSR